MQCVASCCMTIGLSKHQRSRLKIYHPGAPSLKKIKEKKTRKMLTQVVFTIQAPPPKKKITTTSFIH